MVAEGRQFTIASTVTIGIPAFVLALAPSSGPAVAGLCAAMALLFCLALSIPFLRDFYELTAPMGGGVASWAIGSALGIGGMLGALRLLRVS